MAKILDKRRTKFTLQLRFTFFLIHYFSTRLFSSQYYNSPLSNDLSSFLLRTEIPLGFPSSVYRKTLPSLLLIIQTEKYFFAWLVYRACTSVTYKQSCGKAVSLSAVVSPIFQAESHFRQSFYPICFYKSHVSKNEFRS